MLKLFVTYFDRTRGINYEKYDEKCCDQWFIGILFNISNYQKHWTFEGMKNCNKVSRLKT